MSASLPALLEPRPGCDCGVEGGEIASAVGVLFHRLVPWIKLKSNKKEVGFFFKSYSRLELVCLLLALSLDISSTSFSLPGQAYSGDVLVCYQASDVTGTVPLLCFPATMI